MIFQRLERVDGKLDDWNVERSDTCERARSMCRWSRPHWSSSAPTANRFGNLGNLRRQLGQPWSRIVEREQLRQESEQSWIVRGIAIAVTAVASR